MFFPLRASGAWESNQYFNDAFDKMCTIEERESNDGNRMTGRRRKYEDEDAAMFKSPNLHSERRRREKLSRRLLTLRSSVPIITNMNKATIIHDAITYIVELQKNEKALIEELLEVESSYDGEQKPLPYEKDAAQEMERHGIKSDVQVMNIDGNKMWMKVITQKKKGGFTQLMEALSAFGFELTDTCVTTFKGAMLVSSFIEGGYGETLAASQAKELLGQMVGSM
ncbi:hypothetical protein MLD38_027495 [Melastoma candidum]|uniref:Uncharacterized protein n=1 Tax=Melastoma candidum TaxID=119954 RepID=A0ACB9P4M2_9MYRT|nr:hypothetical protein MLD38_027495 [Melastoma candidum]